MLFLIVSRHSGGSHTSRLGHVIQWILKPINVRCRLQQTLLAIFEVIFLWSPLRRHLQSFKINIRCIDFKIIIGLH